MLRNLARREREAGRDASAKTYEKRADESIAKARPLRQLLERGVESMAQASE